MAKLLPLLAVLATLGCAGSGDADFAARARVFLGVALEKGSLVVKQTVARSPARASLEAGDRLVAVGDRPLSAPVDLRSALERAVMGKTLTLTVARKGRDIRVEIVPSLTLLKATYADEPKLNKFCDKNCDCTLDEPGYFCFVFWIYLRDDPGDGMIFLKRCVCTQGPGQPVFKEECVIDNVY